MPEPLVLHEDRFFDPDPAIRRAARSLYEETRDLPLVCPHGHVEASLLARNEAFPEPTELIIIPDHYIFRMLYSRGIPLETLGIPTRDGTRESRDPRAIWQIFGEHYYLFRGTPTGAWIDHELAELFGVRMKLDGDTAQTIYDEIAAQLAKPAFRPRALFERFNIEVLSTTDKATDSLEHHRALQRAGWGGRVIPTFRPDALLRIAAEGWRHELTELERVQGSSIERFDQFIAALEARRAFFKAMGAVATDHAVVEPHTARLTPNEANGLFQRALQGTATPNDQARFEAHMLLEMARMSVEDGLVMQLHAGALRDHNRVVFERFGADKGGDIPVATEYTRNLQALLNEFGNDPRFALVLFTLDETTYARELAPLAGHYPAVKLGPPWWFHDSIEGMTRFRQQTTETAGIYNTAGFNDDTRAFCSIPARHDLSRRVDANFLGGLVARHIVDLSDARAMARAFAYDLAKETYRLGNRHEAVSTHAGAARLGRKLLITGRLTRRDVALPEPKLLDLPERAVQFGTGAFLRGFIDCFLDEANRRGDFGGRVVAIASTRSGRDVALNEQDGLYTLISEGASDTGPVRECRVIASVSRALSAQHHWMDVLSLARAPELEFVFSNTTEVGIAIEDGDRFDAAPPPSFPGKLTRFLLERARAFHYTADAGLVVIPCELIERNGDRLRDLVLTLAQRWDVESDFAEWIRRAVPFCNTLVDRIVPGRPNDARRSELEGVFGFRDDLMIAAEPYRLFAIEADRPTLERLPFAKVDGVVLTDDVTPYRERKVRILNGGHTLLASLGLLLGCKTVIEAVQRDLLGRYLRRILFDEIVPSLSVPDGEAFARDVLTRFANPYLRHALTDITLQHTSKMRVRVIPSVVQFAERRGVAPASLAFGFAAYLLLLRDAGAHSGAGRPALAPDNQRERIRESWRSVPNDEPDERRAFAARVCADEVLWHADLSRVAGFVEQVSSGLNLMSRVGAPAALAEHLDTVGALPRTLASSLSNAS